MQVFLNKFCLFYSLDIFPVVFRPDKHIQDALNRFIGTHAIDMPCA